MTRTISIKYICKMYSQQQRPAGACSSSRIRRAITCDCSKCIVCGERTRVSLTGATRTTSLNARWGTQNASMSTSPPSSLLHSTVRCARAGPTSTPTMTARPYSKHFSLDSSLILVFRCFYHSLSLWSWNWIQIYTNETKRVFISPYAYI